MEQVETTGGAQRKRSPRLTSTGKPIKQGEASDFSKRLKALWADPEWRAKMVAKNRARAIPAMQKAGQRFGVPDGMRKSQAKWFWRQARFEASLTMNKLEKAGVISLTDDVQAAEALHYALTVMRGPQQQRDGLAAAALVLKYTKSPPASKSIVTVNKAEEWLAAISESNAETDESDAGDAEASTE